MVDYDTIVRNMVNRKRQLWNDNKRIYIAFKHENDLEKRIIYIKENNWVNLVSVKYWTIKMKYRYLKYKLNDSHHKDTRIRKMLWANSTSINDSNPKCIMRRVRNWTKIVLFVLHCKKLFSISDNTIQIDNFLWVRFLSLPFTLNYKK